MNWRLKVLCGLVLGAFLALSTAYYKFYVAREARGVILFVVPGLNLELLNLSGIDEETGAGSTPRLARADRVALVNNQTESGLVNPAALISWLSTGELGLPDQIGLSPDGRSLDNLVYQAQRSGRTVGLISNTELDSALLGSFYAHQTSILDRGPIAKQLFDSTAIDVILGEQPAAFQSLVDEGGRNLIKEAEAKGYRIVRSREELDNITLWGTKLLGLFKTPSADPAPVHPPQPVPEEKPVFLGPPAPEPPPIPPFPPMKHLVRQAIRVLQTNLTANLNGYFLVVNYDLTDRKNRTSRAPDAIARIRALNDAIAEARLYAGRNSVIILYVPYDLSQAVETKDLPPRRRRPLPPEVPAHPYPALPAGFGWAAFYGRQIDVPQGFLTPGELHQVIRSIF
ncbi:MAG: alkaline phosphatase [Candidatus Methylacidiphilales bacterium]|nr:alkaline phosphatase [Candidatus Methylacidiphilales bacterium]